MATTIQGKVRASCTQIMAVALFVLLLSASSMAQGCKGKNSWPELVGRDGSTAEAIIKAENPYVKTVQIVPEGSFVIQDFRCDRVFVWVKPNNTIYLTPKIG
ncbi:Glu protease inhibitor [Nymphaea thermarum]|nr:Glu protease inhibitor [Nymphaea thermarum]